MRNPSKVGISLVLYFNKVLLSHVCTKRGQTEYALDSLRRSCDKIKFTKPVYCMFMIVGTFAH